LNKALVITYSVGILELQEKPNKSGKTMEHKDAIEILKEAELTKSFAYVNCGKHEYQLAPEILDGYFLQDDGQVYFWSIATKPHPRDKHDGLKWMFLENCSFSRFEKK
jgi:hypothetical protein